MDKTQLLVGQRQKGESRKAIIACNDYLRMGPGRSLAKLCVRYRAATELPPTKRLKTLKDWSRRYGWQERVSAYEAEQERQKNEKRREVMENGLSLDFERVDELKVLAKFLIDQVYEQGETGVFHNVWLPDVKQVGSGNSAERVDIERFNAAIISELRGVLDDLAKETGGRVAKQEVSGAGGGPVEIKVIYDDHDGTT